MAIAGTYNIESSAQKKSKQVNDSLDVCNYRMIQNYAVNRVPMSNHDYVRGAASHESSSFDLSDSVSFYFMDQSSDDLAIINMEDTLDVCNYRRPVCNNLSSILIDQDNTLTYDDVIAEYSFNEAIIGDQPVDEPNESFDKIGDSALDVGNYRCRSAMHFNRLDLPFSHFSPSPIPTTSSSFLSQFSDQSDDIIFPSSE